MNILPYWLKALKVDTAASAEDLGSDIWDNDNSCSYSEDGRRLLDAENYPDEVHVKDGTEIICDEVFAFQDYMYEDGRLGEEVPDEYRVAFLDKIFLPSSLTHIGKRAFAECGWLRSLRLPASLEVIGEQAFAGCVELRSVSCPAHLLAIGDGVFCECFSLKSARLDKGLKAIGAGAFFDCDSLEEIVLPGGLEFIGDDAFTGTRLKRIFVPKSERGRLTEMLQPALRRAVRNIH